MLRSQFNCVSSKTRINRTRVSTCVLLAALLIGCEPTGKQTDSSEQLSEDTVDQASAPNLIEVPTDAVDTTSMADAELDALPDSAPKQASQITPEQDNIVADMGFSGIEEQASEPESSELYCLNKPSKSEIDPENACRQISKRLASVSYQGCSTARLSSSGCESVSGFPILVREFAPIEGRAPQGKILVIGGTHGDELTSVSVTFRWIQKLNQFHSGLFHWHIAPMMNPDGVLKREASRTNTNGVDLNRNMPSDDWANNALSYWKSKGNKDPRKYPGQAAASEPETQWLIDEINRFEPDAIISVHAPYGVVDFDALLLNTAPKSLGKLHLNLLGTYPGSLGNYAGINRNIPVITLELPHAWEMPSEQETTRIWEDIVSWLKENINNPEKLANAQ